MIFERNTKFIGEFPLRLYKSDLPSIPTRPHGEVQPQASKALRFDQEFIKVLLPLFADVQQDRRIPDRLLHPRYMDIDRAPREVIAPFHPTNRPIHRLTPIPRVDDDGQTRRWGLDCWGLDCWGLVPVGGTTILLGPDTSDESSSGPDTSDESSPYFRLYSSLRGSSQETQILFRFNTAA